MKILCIDFDGVVHSYEKGWQDGSIYGTLMPGFLAWAAEARKHFKLVVYSSRSKTPEGVQAMQDWLRRQLAERLMPEEVEQVMGWFAFSAEKPPAWLTIDDRCVRFDGRWDDPALRPETLAAYKTWQQRSDALAKTPADGSQARMAVKAEAGVVRPGEEAA